MMFFVASKAVFPSLMSPEIYFGYKDRKLIINSEGMDLEASELAKNIFVPVKKFNKLKPSQLPDAWSQRMYEFSNAYNAEAGKGLHNNLWYATVKAHDMGFKLEQGFNLLDDILNYIDDEPRAGFVKTLKRQMMTNELKYPQWVAEARFLAELDA